jgi:hypothetical protein
LRGLAHVVCLGPLVLSRLEEGLGSRLAVDVGQARLFMPGLDDAEPEAMHHPLFSPAGSVAHRQAPRECAAAAQSAVYAWSVSAPRRLDFEALWLAHARACRA